jgi:hypothetical protein
MKEIENALVKKTLLIDQALARSNNDYYYTETVIVKHKTSICGVNAEPYYTYHKELRFKYKEFSKNLNLVNSEISRYLEQINQLTESLSILTSTNQVLEKNKVTLSNTERNKELTENLLIQAKSNLTHYLEKLSEQQRACIVASEFETLNSEYLIETIRDIGFDYNVLASIAIDSDNISLLGFALDLGANLDSHLIENKTLVQHAITKGNSSVINKVIISTKVFENSLFYSLQQNDELSLKVILSYSPELAVNLLFEDYSLLHYAIANNQISTVSYLINTFPNTITQTNAGGDSCFKIALRTGSNEMVGIVSQHVHLTQEYIDLNHDGAIDLINRAVELKLDKLGFAPKENQKIESFINNDITHYDVVTEFSGNFVLEEINII